MPEQNSARVGPPPGAIIAAVSGALIGAAFGRVWLSMAAESLYGWQTGIEVAGWVVLGLFVVAAAFVTLSVLRSPPQWRGERPRRAWAAWLGIVIAVEVTLIAGGQSLLNGVLGHPEWIPVWTLFVVGAHFWPFALILRVNAFRVLAGALCATAVVSALAANLAEMASLWSVVPGVGAAAVFWGFTGWALHRMARGRSLTARAISLRRGRRAQAAS